MPMGRERIVLDGLWRCLCPSFDAIALSRALQTSVVPRPRPPLTHATCQRQFNTTLEKGPLHLENTQAVGETRDSYAQRKLNRDKRYFLREWSRNKSLPLHILNGQNQDTQGLDVVDTPTLLATLREVLHSEGQYYTIANIVKYLVTKRGERPNAFLYECLIRANVDTKHGSIHVVEGLLDEMARLRIPPTSGICHGVLDVLTIHPDATVQIRILRDMKRAWIEMTHDGHLAFTLGLLRDLQHEKALENLEELHRNRIPIPNWLYDIFVYTLAEMGHFEEALMVIQHKLSRPGAASPNNMWNFLLDVFSRDSFFEGIKYVWQRAVTTGIVNPPDGTIMNVLNAACRNGDITLATDTIKILTSRGKKLGMHHFEALLEIYAKDGHLRSAFLSLCLMHRTGQIPDLSSTRPIYRILRDSESQIDAALAVLQDLKLHHQVPVAAFNVVLEATLQHRGFKDGLDLYRSVRQVCSGGPDITTYNLLLKHCTLGRSLGFLFMEMKALRIRPDEAAYNRMIMISTLQDNYDMAFRYLDDMQSRATPGVSENWWMSKDTTMAVLKRCIQAEDVRAKRIFEECKKRGMNIESDLRELVKEVQAERKERKRKALATTSDAASAPTDRSLEVASG